MSKIGIIDADLIDHGTRHPNLALMKIAQYYISQGHEVSLIYKSYNDVYDYDRLFLSKVFNFTRIPEWVLELPNLSFGGTGIFPDGGPNLPDEIEHQKPCYDLYKSYVQEQIDSGKKAGNYADYLDYSIGFTTRGCFRHCSFCVNKKYDHAFKHSPVNEFLDEERPYIYLWDDNILAYPQWEDIINDLEATGKPFQFRQGVDLRLMTDQKAKRLVNTHYHGDFIFAFDHLEDQSLIIEKVQLWKRYSAKICKMYVLSGYKAQDEKDIEDVFQRIQILMKYGSIPYIMRYELYKESAYKEIYIQLARWCNQPQFFKKKSFREFCIANQEYKKNQSANCSAYQAMIDFEHEHPEIANKYYDLRFDKENMYAIQYGYGRKYANKPLCKKCKSKNIYWDNIECCSNKDDFIKAYFTKEIDLECLHYKNAECNIAPQKAAKLLTDIINEYTIDNIINLLRDCETREPVTAENIPQISQISDAIFEVPNILTNIDKYASFNDIGFYLTRNDPKMKSTDVAQKKYGENHVKLAALIDLALVSKSDTRAQVRQSVLGSYYCSLPLESQEILANKLFLRIPIIQDCLLQQDSKTILIKDLEILSEETRKRRGSSVQIVVRSIKKFL